ncbi:sensor histidine kinase [Hymenobacter defluvii]|uniref:Histidine kinase n=1 Tax=Hymenobacter defluvii TaxID=2054411 RepID=A0ABS3T7M5_9BACT|nr:histidine kinase [Hymenobacter defluvii]MBO3269642.1 histidine kinase [Hymenobacter defluvii]
MTSSTFRHFAQRFSRPLLWVMFGSALLLAQPLTWSVQLPPQFWVRQFLLLLLWVALFYFNAQVAVPRLLFRGHTGWFIAVLAASLVAVLALNSLIENLLHLPELMHKAFHPDGSPSRRRSSAGWFDMGTLLISMLVLGISTSVAVVRKWQNDAQIRRELEQQQTTAELSFLKAQINPHFFFNTLNNIYALTVVNGELARQAIHTLSRMMRYVLYETQSSTTLLSQEVSFVQDYISLMQLRLTDKVTVTFERPTPLLRDVPIAPMLLLPFVENAFKHGVSATLPSQIYIGLHQHNGTLTLEVRNTVFPDKRPAVEEVGSGIGLTNTRRRLDLLYPQRYQLSVEEATAGHEFRVLLSLEVVPSVQAVKPRLASADAE